MLLLLTYVAPPISLRANPNSSSSAESSRSAFCTRDGVGVWRSAAALLAPAFSPKTPPLPPRKLNPPFVGAKTACWRSVLRLLYWVDKHWELWKFWKLSNSWNFGSCQFYHKMCEHSEMHVRELSEGRGKECGLWIKFVNFLLCNMCCKEGDCCYWMQMCIPTAGAIVKYKELLHYSTYWSREIDAGG